MDTTLYYNNCLVVKIGDHVKVIHRLYSSDSPKIGEIRRVYKPYPYPHGALDPSYWVRLDDDNWWEKVENLSFIKRDSSPVVIRGRVWHGLTKKAINL